MSGAKTIVDASAYERDGFTIVRSVLDKPLLYEAIDHIDHLRQSHPHLRPEQLGTGHLPMDAFWLRLVGDPRLLGLAAQFIGPDIALFATHYIAKPPRTGRPVLWHQDGSFWPLEPMEVITLWLALDHSAPVNGCLRVIPGTHRKKQIDREEMLATTIDQNALSRAMDPAEFEDAEVVDLVLNPGDISIHNPNIVHGSNANTSDRWRRGLTIRYIPTSTRVTDPDHPKPYLLQSADRTGANLYAVAPAETGGPSIG